MQGNDEIVADVIEEYDMQSLTTSPDNLIAGIDAQPGLGQEVEVVPDNTEEDFCLQLEDSCSSSDDDMNIIGSDPAFQYKPPKKAKRDVTDVLLACRGRGRGRGRRGTTRGRGGASTSPSPCESRLSPTRRGRGRPRGRVGRAETGGRGRGRGNSLSSVVGEGGRGSRSRTAGSQPKRGRGRPTTASRSHTAGSPPKRGRGRPRQC